MSDWTDGRLPVFFEAAEQQPPHRPIAIDAETTPRKLVLRTMFADLPRTVPAAVLLVGHQVGEVLVPIVMGLAIDQAIKTSDMAATVRWVLVLGLVFAFLSFSYRFGSRIGFLGINTVQHRLRTQVTDRILDPRGLGGGHTPGVLLSIASTDVQRLAMAVALGLYPVAEIFAVIFCGIILLSISWELGLLILLGAPALLWCLDKAGGRLRARSAAEQRAAGDAAGSATDLVTGFRVIKGMHAEAEAERRYRSASERALAAVIKARRSHGAYVGAMEAIAAVFVVAVGVVGGIKTVNGALSVGQLITVVGLTSVAMGPMQALGTNFGKVWVAAHASAARVLMVLHAPFARTAGHREQEAADAVPLRFDGVDVGQGALDLTLPVSGVTALVCDAATAAKLTTLLSRVKTPESGTVWAGVDDLYELSEPAALRAVRVAPHTSTLFEGTVGENVTAGSPQQPDRVAAALLAAACDDVISTLPYGLDTSVGEAGRLLSGGQRQRVALARALASDTRTLVLVNPTSAVDSVTEADIAERLPQVRAGTATVIFTHSPTLIAAADHVLTISATGRVADTTAKAEVTA
ncbi:ABC transporter ATP-binding protein [Rhodococcus artemisiae]|uniref:ABC transporter ATP-binding protein n=1 Tax=Rhodococcus artemisiae TaxID=714159 RepID=A0ABU7LBX9_9NOCA|nr:ABC transporter ATP-binding protein [Rhodococcus artemisiae]MEE2059056.1 ABC transporter ATP-binding protein [Rhodococcus artemisiae]